MLDNTLLFFFEEADGLIQAMEKGLNELCGARPEAASAIIEEVFRAAHTLKGTAALMKQPEVSRLAHRLEDILEEAMETNTPPAPRQVKAMLQALVTVRMLVEDAAAGRALAPDACLKALWLLEPQPLTADPDHLGPDENKSPDEEIPPFSSPGVWTSAAAAQVKIGNDKLESLMSLLAEAMASKSQLLRQASELENMRQEVDASGKRLLREVDRFSDRYAFALPEQPQPGGRTDAGFDELEFDQYDEINLFSRKLEEITEDIGEAMRSMGTFFTRISEQVETLDRSIVEIRERVADIRTVKAESLLQRFSMAAPELLRHEGKDIRLECGGGETTLDRVIFDGLYDPLLHLLRNAACHGIEPVQQRIAAGKPPQGTLTLAFSRRGAAVEIELSDDGSGIDLEKIRGRAIEKSLIDPDGHLGERELMQLIFRPGFSTQTHSDAHSGRGMGMNIVQDRLAALNGTLEISTARGRGTSVRMSLPQSLMMINVIEFALGERPFVIPTNLVSEIVDLRFEPRGPQGEILREEPIACLHLGEVLGVPTLAEPPRFALLTRCEGRPLALLVDGVRGQEDCLIKPFGPFLRGLPHLSGTSLSGDGRLRPALNPARLLLTQAPPMVESPAAPAPRQTILVVDDSLSVRKVAAQILESAGYAVLTAPNGREALTQLEQNSVDLVITDLEMPLMHGYELLEQIRQGPWAQLPVAVLSSRATTRHRQKALELGACDYLLKPFDAESLLKRVRAHLP